MTYLEHRREFMRKKIKETFKDNKGDLPPELQDTPLRMFTYDNKDDVISKVDEDLLFSLIIKLGRYIVDYRIDLDKDVTLKEAIEKI